jgi:hypothetical protein
MANAILTADVLLPTAVDASTTADGYRDSDILLDTKPFRVHRTTSASGQTLDFDFGSAVMVAGIYVNHTNYTTLTYTAGATQGAATDSLGARTLYLEELTQRYKGLHLVTMATPRRWLRATISGVLGGAAYAETGAFTFITPAGMTPIGVSYGFPEYEQAQSLEQLAVASQVAARGRPYARISLGQPHLRRGALDASMNAHRSFVARAKLTPHVYSENRDLDGDGTCRHVWLVLLEGEGQRHGLTLPTFSPQNFVVREVIE